MKFKTFESLINACKELHDTTVKKDKAIEEALGGDTSVMTVDYFDTIDNVLKSISTEFCDKSDTLDWFFWDVVTSECKPEELYFEEDGVKYASTMQNAWMLLSGILDERFALEISAEDIEEELINTRIDKMEEKNLDSYFDFKEIRENRNKEKTSGTVDIESLEDIDTIKYFLSCASVEILKAEDLPLNVVASTLPRHEFNLEDKEQLWEDIKEFCYDTQAFKIYIEEDLNYSGDHFGIIYYAEQEVADED